MGQSMKSTEEFAPNERLRRARSLKGWSQTDLAEQVGTSFEMVSRWERGVTVPSIYYCERLCAVLGQSAEELGLLRGRSDAFTPLPSPLVFLAFSYTDSEKPIVSHLKATLQERGLASWSSRQLSRQGTGNGRATLSEIVQAAQAILVIISPQSRSSRHVRETLELARSYQRPVYGVWIEGEHWQEYLPKGSAEFSALIDARTSDDPILIREIATALEQVVLTSPDSGRSASADPKAHALMNGHPTSSKELQAMEPPAGDTLLSASVPLLPPPSTRQRRSISRSTAAMLIVLAVLVIVGGILGSASLLARFGLLGTRSGGTVMRGGTWTDDYLHDPYSLIPNGDRRGDPFLLDQALYLPLFYGDEHGMVHLGAATEVPMVQNGGISADATTWTFHLRSYLVWSDGQPYDARDVDYTWKLWLNPKFGAASTEGLNLITSTDVSADHLSIRFHLKHAYAPFLQWWVDGFFAPLPAHHFHSIAPEAIKKSSENLNPTITSGPFLMSESVPGDHYTLMRNPRYYRAGEGLPYLDRFVYRVVDANTILRDLQAGTITSAWFLDPSRIPAYERLTHYTLTTTPNSATLEGMFFNFHNVILASSLEVRQAMAMAIDRQTLITLARHGFASPLCTDHPSALHPGYQPDADCPAFDLAATNKLLEDNGWVKGPDGVRSKGEQRLEFEYSSTANSTWRNTDEALIQRNFMAIGIKLDIQNYPSDTFFGSLLTEGKASPPKGARAGRYDIAEYEWKFGYDPDDHDLLGCDQIPPNGQNFTFYCNPALDTLYKEEQGTLDPGLRQEIFRQIHRLYLTELPFIVLFSPTNVAMVRKGTHNYSPSPIEGETINIWEWWCDQGKC
jgi:peptide/nickel transport system substrate-binding protein